MTSVKLINHSSSTADWNEYIKNGNETKINGRNLYPIYTKE